MCERPVDRVLSLLQGVRETGRRRWEALCPAHDDHEPSLSVAEGDDGKALIKCHAGCTAEEIVAAIGLEMSDLFANRPDQAAKAEGERGAPSKGGATPGHAGGLNLEDYAAAKKLPVGFLRELGLETVYRLGQPTVRIPYFDADGELVAVRLRLALQAGREADTRFLWRTGDKPELYGPWRLAAARSEGNVVLVEGESDCHALWLHGFSALGLPGANSWKEERDTHHLDGIARIFIVIEPDAGGRAVGRWLAQSEIRDRAWLVSLEDHKDPCEMHVADPDSFRERFERALKLAIPWNEIEAARLEAERAALEAECEELISLPRILDSFAKAIERCGLVGEQQTAKLLYLACTSRLLQEPISLVVKGPSSAGKSYVVKQVLKFFPETSFHQLTGMSEHALVYDDAPLKHRILVVTEASGIEGKRLTEYVKSILTEGRIDYVTVVKTHNRLESRHIRREGPTGLLTTTTAIKLDAQLETRLLSLTVTDTREQTALILRSMGVKRPESFDFTPWHSLQRWLELGPKEVVIPFHTALAKRVPPIAVRLRRDFKALLNLIAAHAILHQSGRARDDDGRIIATVDDYGAVRDLVIELMGEGVEATVSEAVREVVIAADRLLSKPGASFVTISALRDVLAEGRSAVRRRVRAAIEAGYLTVEDQRPGRAIQLRLGEPLPENVEVLPPPETLEADLFGSSA